MNLPLRLLKVYPNGPTLLFCCCCRAVQYYYTKCLEISGRKFPNVRTSVVEQDKTTSLLNPWNEIIN